MKMMLTFSIPVEAGNAAIADGTIEPAIRKLVTDTNAEAAYFMPVDGKRGGVLFFDLDDAARIPQFIEPFYAAVQARIELTPVMTAGDLMRGLGD